MRVTVLLSLLIVFLALPFSSHAQPRGPMWRGSDSYEGMPYGRYCPGPRWGPYGARRTVNTADEAKKAIETYFSNSTQKVKVGKIEERGRFFEAEILDAEGALIDKLIIDKRSGRIRSIY